MNDENWKTEYKDMKVLKPSQIKLLDEGAQSQSQAWLLNAMWCEWKDLKEAENSNPDPSRIIVSRAKDLQLDPWED